MKIILKSMLGKERDHEVTADTKVADIKKFLESEYVQDSVRLSYNNAVLEDSVTMEQLGVRENAAIVYTGKKRSAQQLASKVSGYPPPSSSEVCTKKEEPANNLNITGTDDTSTTIETQPISAPRAETAQQLSGPQPASLRRVDPALIDLIVAMGFEDREQVSLALRAAYMNVDRAVEFLCTGIPSHVQQQLMEADLQAGAANGAVRPLTAGGPVQPGTGGTEPSIEDVLSSLPHIDEVRSLLQSNPQSFNLIAEGLSSNFPQVGELARQDPEGFARFMMADSVPGSIEHVVPAGSGADAEGGSSLQAEDRAAVNRLVSLGEGAWGEQEATEAYRICERNEEAAANFLLSNYLGIMD